MADGQTFAQRWQDYRPSKALLFWACAASIAATIAIGFTIGGWVTGGTSARMVSSAAEDARSQLVATICVQRFTAAADARDQLARLKAESLWERDDFIEKGGWATPAGFEQPVAGAADLCADQLADMTLPAKDAASADGKKTAIQ
ncbi:hypothetical protein [Desertibaculum subflavum]|uniref:hypothetical protein n=1 Tax=Desertibaculum subflavum TaxID=2268458 RepID=UPI000E6727A0